MVGFVLLDQVFERRMSVDDRVKIEPLQMRRRHVVQVFGRAEAATGALFQQLS